METLEHLRELAVRYRTPKAPAGRGRTGTQRSGRHSSGRDSYLVWTEKRQTDVSYLACASFLLENSDTPPMPAFATHNANGG